MLDQSVAQVQDESSPPNSSPIIRFCCRCCVSLCDAARQAGRLPLPRPPVVTLGLHHSPALRRNPGGLVFILSHLRTRSERMGRLTVPASVGCASFS